MLRGARAARQRSSSPKMRLTRRGRWVLLALVVVLALGVGFIATQAQAGDGGAEVATSSMVVAPGDTLWEIAGEVAGNRDVREVIGVIVEMNELPNTNISAGQVLSVPVYQD